jgi:hypothetical protein
MHRKIPFYMVALSSLLTQASYATEYFVKIHYSQEAFGKRVERVMAHSGILCQDWLYNTFYWEDVRDLNLNRVGDHFYAGNIWKGHSSKFGPYCETPVVQYWVSLADGSTHISPVYDMQCDTDTSITIDPRHPKAKELYASARERLDWDLSQGEEVDESSCRRLGYYSTSPY